MFDWTCPWGFPLETANNNRSYSFTLKRNSFRASHKLTEVNFEERRNRAQSTFKGLTIHSRLTLQSTNIALWSFRKTFIDIYLKPCNWNKRSGSGSTHPRGPVIQFASQTQFKVESACSPSNSQTLSRGEIVAESRLVVSERVLTKHRSGGVKGEYLALSFLGWKDLIMTSQHSSVTQRLKPQASAND